MSRLIRSTRLWGCTYTRAYLPIRTRHGFTVSSRSEGSAAGGWSFRKLPDLLLRQPRPPIPIPVNSASIPGQQNRRIALRLQAPAFRAGNTVLRLELAGGLAHGVPEVTFVAGHAFVLLIQSSISLRRMRQATAPSLNVST